MTIKHFVLIVLSLYLTMDRTFGQSQGDMTFISGEATKRVEKKLDSIYLAISKLYSKDKLFIGSLKDSQKAWKIYYSSQIKAKFPDYPDASNHYGSSHSLCVTTYARHIAEGRIIELEKWLIGNDGMDCDDSVKPQDELPAYRPYILFTPND